MKILKNEEFIAMISFILFVIIFFTIMFVFSNWRKNQCIKKGGYVIENNLGIMEKCVIGDKGDE